jgi:hypothetical protein
MLVRVFHLKHLDFHKHLGTDDAIAKANRAKGQTDLQNITQKTKDRATLTTKKNRDEPRCSGISELAIFKRLSVLI